MLVLMPGLSCIGNIPWLFLCIYGITGCGSASQKLCAYNAASSWSQSPSPDSQCIEQSPCNWETNMHQNIVLTIFHAQNIFHHMWKTVKTTLHYIICLQSLGEMMRQICPIVLNCFSNILPDWRTTKHQSVFWEFSTYGEKYFVCGKLSELHFDTKLSPNRGDAVL